MEGKERITRGKSWLHYKPGLPLPAIRERREKKGTAGKEDRERIKESRRGFKSSTNTAPISQHNDRKGNGRAGTQSTGRNSRISSRGGRTVVIAGVQS